MDRQFTCFFRLPTELRLKIWRLCEARARVAELDLPIKEIVETDCDLLYISLRNCKQPAFAQACREARQVAFEDGGFLWEIPETKGIPDLCAVNRTSETWFYPRSDIVHLNWTAAYELYGDDPDSVSVLNGYRPVARAVSFMADATVAFDWSGRGPTFFLPVVDRSVNAHLQPRKEYMVCLAEIIIHATEEQVLASGTFEGLAAPIQILDPFDDHKAVHAMHQLWQHGRPGDSKQDEYGEIFDALLNPEIFANLLERWREAVSNNWLGHVWAQEAERGTLSEIDGRDQIWRWRDLSRPESPFLPGLDPELISEELHCFNLSHPWVVSTLASMPIFRPMILFRHCERDCW
ncbi:hypothetical protein BKA67DRAFT_289088 [Truncatella angustata]|uniref:2EXR domain-containing protein n=1 Tax=Truncatella angustata TaxID=152316 RepID=A0A9P8UMN7_9PEZI|nr:uncharacterized protein BKA67DRAFT_289088 [Truncatella angustata]KAH6654772.1 hypothetical protein BKA67DRAFT_289088 [Truncatella angustata]KAH8196211.1 hypothetical protein TruAng_009627 [Truncatella angustata]